MRQHLERYNGDWESKYVCFFFIWPIAVLFLRGQYTYNLHNIFAISDTHFALYWVEKKKKKKKETQQRNWEECTNMLAYGNC